MGLKTKYKYYFIDLMDLKTKKKKKQLYTRLHNEKKKNSVTLKFPFPIIVYNRQWISSDRNTSVWVFCISVFIPTV